MNHAPAASADAHRILVVDDDDVLRETIKEIFEMEGFAVSTAENGLEALESIAALGRPCFVLLDLMMPVMDGSTFLATVRQGNAPSSDPLQVVVFSALSEASSLASHYGCEFLSKQVSMDQLIDTATRLCPP